MELSCTADKDHAETDQALLDRCFEAINKKHFKGQIQASVRWQVPQGTVSILENPGKYQLNREDMLVYQKALALLKTNQNDAAGQLLKPLAEAGHKDSQLAMCHLLKRTNGNWQRYAELHNAGIHRTQWVPAACYYPESQIIAIHPYLLQRNIPQFVLRYLIYHECCHQAVPSQRENHHSEEFMVLERQAPHRERAIRWLEKEGFPIIRDP